MNGLQWDCSLIPATTRDAVTYYLTLIQATICMVTADISYGSVSQCAHEVPRSER